MVILIDCDNVMCMLQERVIDIFNNRHGTGYTLDDFTDYNIENNLPIQEAIDFKKIYGESGLYDTIKPIPGAQNGIRKLIDNGHNVFVVTDAIPDTYGEKVSFIKHYFPFIEESHIVAMKHKEYFRCDIMIEDNLQNLLAKPYYDRILVDYPWNRNTHDEVHSIRRCTNWDEILEAVNEFCNTDEELMSN